MSESSNDRTLQSGPSPLVNTADPRQDVHRLREHDPELARYGAAEKLLPDSSAGSKVLELGGGIGAFAERLTARGYDVAFADLSESNLRRAADAGFETHALDLNYPLPFEDATFDGVTMLELIEHIVAAEQLLDETARVLKPGGFVILSTPNFSFIQNRLRILRGKLSIDEGYHYRFFNPAVLDRRLRNAGLVPDASSHLMPAFGVNKVRNKLLGRPRKHVRVVPALAPVCAHTLLVRARKPAA